MFLRSAAFAMTCALVLAQGAISDGTYRGDWTGASANGDFVLTVQSGAVQKVSFTLGGQEVASKIVSQKIDGTKIQAVYEFDLQGNKLQSAITGALKGKTIEGSYKTTAGDQAVDEGTWKASAP
jgi:hypothetical protein